VRQTERKISKYIYQFILVIMIIMRFQLLNFFTWKQKISYVFKKTGNVRDKNECDIELIFDSISNPF